MQSLSLLRRLAAGRAALQRRAVARSFATTGYESKTQRKVTRRPDSNYIAVEMSCGDNIWKFSQDDVEFEIGPEGPEVRDEHHKDWQEDTYNDPKWHGSGMWDGKSYLDMMVGKDNVHELIDDDLFDEKRFGREKDMEAADQTMMVYLAKRDSGEIEGDESKEELEAFKKSCELLSDSLLVSSEEFAQQLFKIVKPEHAYELQEQLEVMRNVLMEPDFSFLSSENEWLSHKDRIIREIMAPYAMNRGLDPVLVRILLQLLNLCGWDEEVAVEWLVEVMIYYGSLLQEEQPVKNLNCQVPVDTPQDQVDKLFDVLMAKCERMGDERVIVRVDFDPEVTAGLIVGGDSTLDLSVDPQIELIQKDLEASLMNA